ADAAAAVGARAYAVGQDIHFAAGQFAPDDPFGVHLIAHEVAHTVQQAGGPIARQHKLTVSTPGDAAEIQADRAADAIVRAEPAAIAPRAAGLRRVVDPAAAPVETPIRGLGKGKVADGLDSASVYAKPDDKSPVTAQLAKGKTVKITATAGDFYVIELDGAK